MVIIKLKSKLLAYLVQRFIVGYGSNPFSIFLAKYPFRFNSKCFLLCFQFIKNISDFICNWNKASVVAYSFFVLGSRIIVVNLFAIPIFIILLRVNMNCLIRDIRPLQGRNLDRFLMRITWHRHLHHICYV